MSLRKGCVDLRDSPETLKHLSRSFPSGCTVISASSAHPHPAQPVTAASLAAAAAAQCTPQ
eukprot:352068-Chlamydomonas_euryale.AAC.10